MLNLAIMLIVILGIWMGCHAKWLGRTPPGE